MNRTLYDPAVEERGRMIGRQEVWHKAWQEGFQIGFQIGLKEGLQIAARNLLRLGFDFEKISEVTEISVDEIMEMKALIQDGSELEYISKIR